MNREISLLLIAVVAVVASPAAAQTAGDARSRVRAVVASGAEVLGTWTFPVGGEGVPAASPAPVAPKAAKPACRREAILSNPSRLSEACARVAIWEAKSQERIKVPDSLAKYLDVEVPALRAAVGDLDTLRCRSLSPEELDAALHQMLATAPENAADCADSPAPAPGDQTSTTQSRPSIFRDPNFVKCVDLYKQSGTAAEAADYCLEMAPRFRFVDNANFDACFKIFNDAEAASYAVQSCAEIAPTFNFVDNQDFKDCYAIYSESQNSAKAANTCITRLKSLSAEGPRSR